MALTTERFQDQLIISILVGVFLFLSIGVSFWIGEFGTPVFAGIPPRYCSFMIDFLTYEDVAVDFDYRSTFKAFSLGKM